MQSMRVYGYGHTLILSFCFIFLTAAPQRTDPSEVNALIEVKRSLIDPMDHLRSWNKGDPCKFNWTGVSCFNTVGTDGYFHVQKIYLMTSNLSGSLAPQLGQLSHLRIMSFMWNGLTGTIPKEIGNITSLKLLLLSGNKLSGTLPDELGNLSNLIRLQVDENQLSGSIPQSFVNLISVKHLHMNNNSFDGQIPPELSKLSNLLHLLVDNNNLSGYLPPEFSLLKELRILQLDNNYFSRTGIPSTYANLSKLAKLSLRNCSLNGAVPDLSWIQELSYLDLSWNHLTGSIPSKKLADNMTTIDLSNNHINGSILESFSDLPFLQRLSLENNFLSGSIPAGIWQNMSFSKSAKLTVDLQNNSLSDILGDLDPPANVTLRLAGNPICKNSSLQNISQYCGPKEDEGAEEFTNSTIVCPVHACPVDNFYEYVPASPLPCTLLIARRHVRYQHRLSRKPLSSNIPIKIDGVKTFTFEELAYATNNFSSSTVVGQGGYGKVYKGILSDETVVAIKRAQEGSLQGQKEFLTEIEFLSRLHHRNLVSMIGYCDEEGEQILVYEFMPNGTLRDWLSGKTKENLNFGMRLRVAMGSAKGILYLHTEANPPIFHRDIKASNILLDSKLIAKVADFGLSRIAPYLDDEGTVPKYVSTVVKGTPGYLDPEYFLTHKLTDKSDVYSLGIVFLELLTGMPPISHGKNIVREVNVARQSGVVFSIIDNRMGCYPSDCVERFLSLALNCCHENPEKRPSMLDVVRELENILAVSPERESTFSDITSSYSGITAPSSSASYMTREDQHVFSSSVSGSDLVSGVTPTIVPR